MESNVKHNWLYSVVPQFPVEGWDIAGIYLVGYCKQCRNYFTARLVIDANTNFVAINKLDIPVFGCEPVE